MSEKLKENRSRGLLHAQLERLAKNVIENQSLMEDSRRLISRIGGEFPMPDHGPCKEKTETSQSVIDLLNEINDRLERTNREFATVNNQAQEFI